MLDQLLAQLQNPDSETRKQAVRQIANLRDPAALPHLARLYRTDSDPAVRELALKAGRFIRDKAEGGESEGARRASSGAAGTSGTGGASSTYDAYGTSDDTDDDYATSDSGAAAQKSKRVSEKDREMARSLLDSAAGFAMKDDPARGVDLLGKALALDPGLRKDSFTINLVKTFTDMDLEQAYPILVHPDRREALIEHLGGKRKVKREQKHGKGAADASWDRAAMDFAIFWVLCTIVVLVLGLILVTAFVEAMDEYAATNPSSSNLSSQELDDIANASMVGLLVFSLFVSTGYTIGLAINGAALHFAATYIFGGDGTLVYLYRRYVNFYTIVVAGIGVFGVALAFFESPAVMFSVLAFGGVASSVVIIYFQLSILSDVYAFGMGSGCGTLIVAGIILAVVQCGAQWMLAGLLSALLQVGA